ncbi:MAG TPA: thioredoxin domain-containing protein [Gemmatimonadaceae bacterium]|nr:thioredoxin domain-containing protein [Gemmatimonadaceae bacterium]
MLVFAGLSVTAGCRATAAPPADGMSAAVAYTEGDTAAPVHVIYFDDYVCDDCAKFSKEAVEPLHRDWVEKGRAQLTLVDLAWHRGSVAGSAAASCAAEQGKFWPMHTLLFERQEVWKRVVDIPAQMVEYAAELGMDTTRFRQCASSKRHQARLDAAEDVARRYAVRGTPAFVVNGRLYYGSQQWSWVEQVLAANERGTPDAAPPPPLKVPTKQVVDSARLRAIQDSLTRGG